MNADECAGIIGTIRNNWPNVRLNPDVANEMLTQAAALDARWVKAALDGYIREGSQWPPNLATLLARARAIASSRPVDHGPRIEMCLDCGGYNGEHVSFCHAGDGAFTLHPRHPSLGMQDLSPDNPVLTATPNPDVIRRTTKGI